METTIKLHHGISGEEIFIFTHKIFGYTYSSAQRLMHLYADAGAVLPVKETQAEITDIIERSQAVQQQQQTTQETK